MNSSVLDLASAFYARLANSNLDGALSLLAADVNWLASEGFPTSGSYHSPESVRKGVFARLTADWMEFTVVPERFISTEPTVVVLGHYTGRYRSSSQRLNARFAHVWEGADGQLTQFLQISDTAIVRDAMRP